MTPSRVDKLTWDSDFFGFPVGRVSATRLAGPDDAAAVVAEAKAARFRCVYFLADATDSASWAAAAGAGFTPVDIRVELARKIDDSFTGATDLATASDENALLAVIANDLFAESRFFRDPRFGREHARRLFEIWTSRGVRDDGWFTAIERASDGIAGFVTCRVRDEKSGSIELVAVAESSRGKGVGRRIVQGALAEFAQRGLSTITVVTQGSNLAAQRLYTDHGFRVTNCSLWFHLWL